MKFRSVTPVLPDYEQGMSVELNIDIENDGADGMFDFKAYEVGTERYLGGMGDFLRAGESKVYKFLAGTMPAHDWNIRCSISP